MRRYIITFSSVLLLQGVLLQAWGQDYQRAKDVLKAVVSKETVLFQFPSPTSKRIIKLPKNAPVYIYGKQGGFLDVRYKNLKGWGDSRSFIIQGAAAAAPEPPKTVEPTISSPVTPVKPRESTPLPIRINPIGSYVMKGKSFADQLRLGVEATYSLKPHLSVGAVADFVFLKGTYLDIGPIVRHQWGSGSSMVFNPAFYAGLLYYAFDHDGDKDSGFGIQWAFQNDIPIMRNSEFQPSISMKIGTDIMYFGFDEVRIPVFLSAGAAFKF